MGQGLLSSGSSLSQAASLLASIATIVASVGIMIGLVIALRELRAMGRAQRFAGIQAFYALLDSTVLARQVVYQLTTSRLEEPRELSPDQSACAEAVVNLLNKIVYLLDQRVVPRDTVFRMCHTMIVRLTYCLTPFILQREQTLGARWGRRVLELGDRARKYHELNPKHRPTPIRLTRPGGSAETIFQVDFEQGLRGRWKNVKRDLKWLLRKY